MAWNGLTKEELIKAGLDPDEIGKLKTSVDGLDSKIKSAVEEANKVNVTTLTGIQETLQALQAKLSGPVKQEQGSNNDNTHDTDETTDWLMEPEKAATKLIDSKVGSVAVLAANMRSDMNYSNFKSTGPRGFSKFEKEIKEMYDKEPLATRCNPKLIENIYKIVVADHIDEIAKTGETFFVEPTTGGKPSGTDTPKKKPEELLTKDELEQCTKWGIAPEDYLKEKSEISGVTYV